MLINEIVENTNNFPLLEKDYIKDGDVVKHKGGEFVWSEPLNTFSVRKQVQTSRNPQLVGVKVGKPIPQGTKAEWEILRSAGIVRSGIDKDGYSQLNPTMKTRFKNLFGKGPGSKNFSRQNTKEPEKEPGYFGKIGQDIQSQDGRGIGRKAGAAVGSAIGQAIGGVGNFFSQTGRDLDKRSKDKNNPETDIDKDNDNDKNKNKQKVIYVPDGEPGDGTPDTPVTGEFGDGTPDTGTPDNTDSSPLDTGTPDNTDRFNNSQDNLDPEVDLDVPTFLRNKKKKPQKAKTSKDPNRRAVNDPRNAKELKDMEDNLRKELSNTQGGKSESDFQIGDNVKWKAEKKNKNIQKGDIVSSVIQAMPGGRYKVKGVTKTVPQSQVLMKTRTGLYYLKPMNLISKA